MLVPLRDEVYIYPIFDSPKSSSGLILIPDEARQRCDQGIVRLVGPKCNWLKTGDYVLFPNYNGTLMFIEDSPWIIMQEMAVTAKLDLNHKHIQIPGLFHQERGITRDKEGKTISDDTMHFPATFESAMKLITEALAENPIYKDMRDYKDKRQRNET